MNPVLWLKLLAAMIAVESGGDWLAVGDNGRSHGGLQIGWAVVEDVNRVYGTAYVWPDDAYDEPKARQIAQLYMHYWAIKKHGPAYTAEQAARIWNGGPNGATKTATLPYWRKIEKRYVK
jgi:hypothetical protein